MNSASKTNSSIAIIPTEEKYVDDIFSIEFASFPDPWSKTALIGEISAKHSICRTAINQATGEVLGHVTMRHIINEGHINNIVVAPAHRRKGVAAQLLTALIETAQQYEMIGITLEARAGNYAAISLYEKYGFKIEGLRKNYYHKPSEDAVIMWLYFSYRI